MNTTNYPGPGSLTNCNPETGIRFGVIHTNKLGEFAWDEITNNGTDQDFEDYSQGIKDNLRDALKDTIGKDALNEAVESAYEAVSYWTGDRYEQPGDCTRYHYSKDGLEFTVASDGDIFVLKSPVVTYAQFCSPCAPGACYLTSPLGQPYQTEANRCYCLPADWFDDDKAPYPIFELNPDGTTKL